MSPPSARTTLARAGSAVASGCRNSERGGSGDAIGKADRGMLAVVAASADPVGFDRHLRPHGYQRHPGVTEQRKVGFDGVGIAAEDAGHLVADFRGVDRRQPGGPPEQRGSA